MTTRWSASSNTRQRIGQVGLPLIGLSPVAIPVESHSLCWVRYGVFLFQNLPTTHLAVSPPSDILLYMKKIEYEIGEIYHIFNRGVDKRKIFSNQKDLDRFFESMIAFNSVKPIGSLFEQGFQKEEIKKPLVDLIAYNLLSNHFHLILGEIREGGISEYMKRLAGGYTWYFNNKNKRSGVLFQGTFKGKHIDSNEYLLRCSVYVNLNDKIPLGGETAKSAKSGDLTKSSWGEYMGENEENVCKKDIILEQFKNIKDYKEFALSSLDDIRSNKEEYKDLEE